LRNVPLNTFLYLDKDRNALSGTAIWSKALGRDLAERLIVERVADGIVERAVSRRRQAPIPGPARYGEKPTLRHSSAGS
jgi:hypothetical protein